MAYTDQQVIQWFKDNPNATDAQIAQVAAQAGVSAEQLSRVTGVSSGEILARANTAGVSLYTPEQQTRQAEIDSWVKNSEPVEYQNLYKALQSGRAKVQMVEAPAYTYYSPENGGFVDTGTVKQLGVVDASGKPLQGVSVDPNTGQIRVPTSNGTLYVNTQIDNTGTLAPIAPENYNKQVTYQSSGSDWDQLGGLALTAAGIFGAPYLSSLIGGATGLTGANLAAATGATIGGTGAALTGGDVLKGALLGGAGGYVGGSLTGSGASPDLGMNSNLTMAQIESGLGTPGYGYSAQAASSGLFNPAVIGSGAYTQTSYPYDMSEFLAADALQLQGQVGNNLPAIEQNLIASGVDPLVAADVANQVALNPDISQYDLTNYINTTFGGGNIYDVNMATQYPTSQLPEEGGLLSDLQPDSNYSNEGRNYPTTESTQGAGGSPVNAATAGAGALTASQIANLIRGALALAGAGTAVSNMGGGGGGGGGGVPTQGVPIGNQDYYNAIQQYYNAYMPAAPRDVATPLQNWYDNKYGSGNVADLPVSSPSNPSYPQTAGITSPTVNQTPVQAPVAQASPTYPQPSTGLFSVANTAENQLNTLLASPTLNNLPASAVSAITNAVMSPRSFNDVVASGGKNTVDISSLSPEVQRAYDLYQQSMILGANSSEVERAYAKAGVDRANPDAFFASQGLLTGTPTQTALAQYAPLALEKFAKTGGGALTFAVDPSTVPSTYTAPVTSATTNFNMGRYADTIASNPNLSSEDKQRLITQTAAKYGFNASNFL